ncbi:MAG: sugar phosphate isomerase/epimerase [Actinobacteria bacterium]|nr:sugar phosphate isomerase/epimerase [Actinomycetota bacterium]
MKLNVDAHLWCLGTYAERYVPGGYFEPFTTEEQLRYISEIKGLDGLFVFYPGPESDNPKKLLKTLADLGLRPSNVAVECWGGRKWKHGAFSTSDVKIRKEVVQLFKGGVDFAREIKADSLLLWPAHDGFDYPFQNNYVDGWNYMVETVREIGEYARDFKIAVEYKSKDPRQKVYINTIGKLMMFLNDVGLDNVGGAFDVGHSLMAQESLAESLALMAAKKKLYQIHLNENYKDADPDMIFGTINFWEILEMFYYLNKTDFEGWCSIDVIAPRDDRVKMLQLGVNLIHDFKKLSDKLMKHEDEIDRNLKKHVFVDNMDLIRKIVFS